MADADKVVTTCLAVGQGMGNLVEFYSGGELIYLALFDLGGNRTGNIDYNTVVAVHYLERKMKERGSRCAGYEAAHILDLVVISHQDDDHWMLFNNFFGDIPVHYEYKGDNRFVTVNRTQENGVEITKQEYLYTALVPGKDKKELVEVAWRLSDGDNVSITRSDTYTKWGNDPSTMDTNIYAYGPDTMNLSQLLPVLTGLFPFLEFKYKEDIKISSINISIHYFEDNTPLHIITLMEDGKKDKTEVGDVYKYNGEQKKWEPMFYHKHLVIALKADMDFFKRLLEEKIPDLTNIQELIGSKDPHAGKTSYIIRKFFMGGVENSRELSTKWFVDAFKWLSVDFEQLVDSRRQFLQAGEPDNVHLHLLCSLEEYTGFLSYYHSGKLPNAVNKHNYCSSVILVILNQHDAILFPGDSTVHTVAYMAENCIVRTEGTVYEFSVKRTGIEGIECSLLSVPHHGSKSTMVDSEGSLSVLEEWIDILSPLYCEVSAGHKNSFGHPNREVVDICLAHSRYESEIEHSYSCADIGITRYSKTNKGFYTNLIKEDEQEKYVHQIFTYEDRTTSQSYKIAEDPAPEPEPGPAPEPVEGKAL